MKTIVFFNNKGGVGKTSLVYHLAWMFAEHGVSVIAADLDPQANLTSMFLDEDRLEEIWPEDDHPKTVFGVLQPILKGTGDIADFKLEEIMPDYLGLIPGDLGLSLFEDKLSAAWPLCHNKDEGAFRVTTAFYRMIERAAEKAELVLIDVGPNLGAINRSALIASDMVCVPLAPDLFSLQGLKNLGPTLRNEWRSNWQSLLSKVPKGLSVPKGSMEPVGYVVMQPGMRENRPVKAYLRWMKRIPGIYRTYVLDETARHVPSTEDDPHALAVLRHYRSLMPMAMEARKPMFHLKPADGAIGAHVEAVRDCYNDFKRLAQKIAAKAGIAMKAD